MTYASTNDGFILILQYLDYILCNRSDLIKCIKAHCQVLLLKGSVLLSIRK